ncbi:serine/threonine-protein kinase-like protein GIN4 [Dendryphion nanum]|uniref:non-specific serine/threonine protein kinase n=1 Tax=Dendryphion nanum TaxID=256645 RepID=A0A9P9DDB5_9PLEO|nr:serine/threonine-protein kinase-like protein GIN4 [Dendryphion nanum]
MTDHVQHGRPPTRRMVLGDATARANENANSHRRKMEKLNLENVKSSSGIQLPHDENGMLSVGHSQPSPENKRLSAVINEETRPHNTKRNSDISNASTDASGTSRRHKKCIGPWELGKTIGRGACSRVRVVRNVNNGKQGAAKIISKSIAEKLCAISMVNLIKSAETDPTMRGGKIIPFGLEREICIMKLLDHPNIVRLLDVWENRNELYLVMEFVEGGELFSYISEMGLLPEMQAIFLFRQIIAALSYCHRLNIHHRDLKPENILLDRETMTIKLVDFGMAALQPSGKMLTTPCGSPHYAAPEVIQAKQYDGAKADIWSCGVILFVMLTGGPPFNYSGTNNDLHYLYHDITTATYDMPSDLSSEAKNLIRKIFVTDPKARISMDGIWNHAFMNKYHNQLRFCGKAKSMEYWIGSDAIIHDWVKLENHTIDREILRYLRTLWHSEREEVLIQRLTAEESNQEKYFYSALIKFRNEYLEDYAPGAHAVSYSNSDHHHCPKPSPTTQDIQNMHTKQSRSQSGYSILNNEHLYSQHSFFDPPMSDASYDPFRASRDPILPPHNLGHNVTINRGTSMGSRKLRPGTALGHRTGSSLRIQALRNNSSRKSSEHSRHSSKRSKTSSRSERSVNVKQRSISRSSVASSYWPSSPPVVVRSGGLGKRGVSFSHLRRGSLASASTGAPHDLELTPEQRRFLNRCSRDSMLSAVLTNSINVPSPLPAPHPLAKTPAHTAVPRLKLRKPESPSKYIQSEARKVSTELEKCMEEAFNRSSMSESIRTSNTDPAKDVSEYDTPPTSFINRELGPIMVATPSTRAKIQNRPLPPIPNETPNTFLQRKLAETRADIAKRAAQDGDITEHFNDILAKLDNLMVPPATMAQRACSAPASRSPEQLHLPAISEEAKTDSEDRYEPYSSPYRAFTDPIRPSLLDRRAVTEHSTTIRVVDQSPIAPLNIRKRSVTSNKSRAANERSEMSWPGSTSNPPVRPFQAVQNDLRAVKEEIQAPPNRVSSSTTEKPENVIKKKKSLWFRRNTEEKDRPADIRNKVPPSRLQIPQAWQGLDDRIEKATPTSPHPLGMKKSIRSISSEFPIRNREPILLKNETTKERKGFLGFFGKKSKEEKAKRGLQLGLGNVSSSSINSAYDIDEESSPTGRAPELQTNWLSRFLHIKPASKTLCFQIGRGRVRNELVLMLRGWQDYGIRDVVFDRRDNTITARVDKNNREFEFCLLFHAWMVRDYVFEIEVDCFYGSFPYLKIKPVSLVIELFALLNDGRRANLCLARFTQTRGAASSFRKAVDIVEDVCRDRGMIVENEGQRVDMCAALG